MDFNGKLVTLPDHSAVIPFKPDNMKYKKIVLAGGSGFIGNVLVRHFSGLCEKIVVLGRGHEKQEQNVSFITWDAKDMGLWINELEGADMLVNLTGKNVNCRYNKKNREEILASRLDSTRILGKAVAACVVPPAVWVQCASATIYRHSEDRPMDEFTGEIGEGFSEDVCRQWEQAFHDQPCPLTRKVLLRIAIVFGNGGGAFPRLKNLARIGLGGKQGNGGQMISWIHEADVAAIVHRALDEPGVSGIYNCSAPSPLTNTRSMEVIREKMGVSLGLPVPAWLLKLGAGLIGTETELIFKSRWVVPVRLEKEGFVFRYARFEDAIADLVKVAPEPS
jgi:uncharacterized protein (TIGR01777 family)